MRLLGSIASILLLAVYLSAQPPAPLRTLRVDYFHTGNTKQELFSLDEAVIEPAPWPGTTAADDGLGYGTYAFDVRDARRTLLYSRGFSSIYEEWVTTEEAGRVTRTFHESARFPMPAGPVTLTIRKRESGNKWRDVWTMPIDPADMFVNTATPEPSPGPVIELLKSGDSATKVDVLLLGDGYTAAERGKFEADAKRLVNVLFATSPFKERRGDFNVWGLVPASRDSGVSRPSLGIHRANPVSSTYDAFGSERYVLAFDNKAFRRLASYAPYDAVEIVVNDRTYGGGGIYGLYSTVAADNAFAPYVFVHEFAHHFGALADEYYTSPVAYLPSATREEPWVPNVTALLDPQSLKWRDLVKPGTPLPSRWEKETYEKLSRESQARRAEIRKQRRPESEMEALFEEERKRDEAMFAKYRGSVGAYEGAMYEAKGYYRPEANCIMFTRTDFFCEVCQRALNRVIDTYTRR